MDIATFSERLQKRIKDRLDNLDINNSEIFQIGSAITFLREIIYELKNFTIKYDFNNDAEEIKFFKEQKPFLLSQLFFYKKIFMIKTLDSFGDLKSKRYNYRRLLRQME